MNLYHKINNYRSMFSGSNFLSFAAKSQPLEINLFRKILTEKINDFIEKFIQANPYEDWGQKVSTIEPHITLGTQEDQIQINFSNITNNKHSNYFETLVSDFLRQLTTNYGWFVNTVSPGTNFTITMQPNYGQRVQVTGNLYHIISFSSSPPKDIIKSILKQGLLPRQDPGQRIKTVQREYPNRIYLLTDAGSIEILKEKFRKVSKNAEYTRFLVLEINASKLLKGTKFYTDPEDSSGKSVYTYSRIPPEAISCSSQSDESISKIYSERESMTPEDKFQERKNIKEKQKQHYYPILDQRLATLTSQDLSWLSRPAKELINKNRDNETFLPNDPPNFITDKKLWDKVKKAVMKRKEKYSEPWAVIFYVYNALKK